MQNLVIDITKRGVVPPIIVTEYDAMSRFFTLTLMDGGTPYTPPENASYTVWYKTADGEGWYDTITLPDESTRAAITADGNVLTVEIAEAATTSCGELAVMITGDDGYQLTVTGIMTRSADIPGYDGEEVENYYNVYITEMRENAARAENAADIAVAYGATVEVDEEAQQLNITHHSDTEGGVGWLFGSAVTSSAEGSVAAFADGANDVAVKSLVANIMPVQSGSGDPSPTNIRPISGRTGLTVRRCGKNLSPKSTVDMTSRGITAKANADGSVHFTGTATAEAVITIMSNFTLPAGSYVWSSGLNESFTTYDTYLSSGGTIARGNANAPGPSFTLTETRAITANVRVRNGQTVDITVKPMVRVAGTSDTFKPYTAQTYPVTWESSAGTIYGGTLNVTTGVLTKDRVYAAFAASGSEYYRLTQNTAYSNMYVYANGALGRLMPTNESSDITTAICNMLPPTSRILAASTPGVFEYHQGNSHELRFSFPRESAYDSVDKIYALGLNVVIPLAEPIATYQLTPTEVRTILGGNTIYTDAGAVSVEYVADTKLYIDGKIAELQALILEN